MSEIEKMYENARIKQTQDITCGDCEFVNYPEENKPCNACTQYGIKHYPPFTTEKQIAILQLLTQQCDLTISHFREWEFIHYDGQEPLKITGKDFTETFAKLINTYWQDLTEEEKQQVKGILE